MSNKILPGNETVVLIPAIYLNGDVQLIGDTLVPISAPTSTVINKWFANTSTETLAAGGNISAALKNDLALALTASQTDADKTILSYGNTTIPTFLNYEAKMNGFRDEDPDALGVFNLFRDLTFGPDAPYVVAHRLGFKNTIAAAAGQDWSLYYGITDNPIPGYTDGGNQTIGEALIPKNFAQINVTLSA